MYAKTKELGPVGGVRRAHPLDPPMVVMVCRQGSVTGSSSVVNTFLLWKLPGSVCQILGQNFKTVRQFCIIASFQYEMCTEMSAIL